MVFVQCTLLGDLLCASGPRNLLLRNVQSLDNGFGDVGKYEALPSIYSGFRFLHLRSSMHRLNYMNKGYKMYYKRLMEQPDEEKRDEMLGKLAEQIWKIDGSGKCTNRYVQS